MSGLRAPNTAVIAAATRPTPWWRTTWFRWTLAAVVFLVLVVIPFIADPYSNQTMTRIMMWAVAILGLNVVMGYAGQVSLGQIFFVGVGAYATAITLKSHWGVDLGLLGAVIAFVLAAVIPGVLGFLVALAAARLRGIAIAMVTIALPIVGVPLAKRFSDLTGGAPGISPSSKWFRTPDWLSGLLYDDQYRYLLALVIAGIVFLLVAFLVRGKFGRAFAIVKANESVASAMGISPYRTKVLAFTIASAIGGIGGFLYVVVNTFTSPDTLSFPNSINLIIATIVGGAGTIIGPILGGVYFQLVTQIPTALQASQWTTVIQGIVILLVLFLLPGGLASLPRVIRRLTAKRPDRHVGTGTAPAPIPGNPGTTKE